MIITSEDLIDFKPYLKKISGIEKDSTILDNYIEAGILNVEAEMLIEEIDINDAVLVDNVIYKNVYLQNIFLLYLESLNIVKVDENNLNLIKTETKKYYDMLSKFKSYYFNLKKPAEEDKKPYLNNIDLILT